jgi:hypothetical protein
MKRHIVTLTSILILAGTVHAAQIREQLSERYIASLAVLLDSESKAVDLVKQLDLYSEATPYRYETILSTAQRLLATRPTAQARRSINVLRIFRPCADAATSIDGSDGEFSEIALILGGMLNSDGEDTFAGIVRLESLGIPAWRFIATGVGRSEKTVKNLSFSRRLGPNATAELLLWSFSRSYNGMAERLAKIEKKKGAK